MSSPDSDPPREIRSYRTTYDLATVIRRRNSLTSVLEAEYGGRPLGAGEFDRFLAIVADELELAAPHWPTLADSLRHLVGTTPDHETLRADCHRLAGNRGRLLARKPVVPWQVQRTWEWVPVQVMAAHPARDVRDRWGARLLLKIMAGTPCPLAVFQFWSLKRCRVHARDFGFSRPRGSKGTPPRYPYTTPAQLVTLRYSALVDPERSGREPHLEFVQFTPSLSRWNKEQIRRRARLDPGYTCPEGHPSSFPCHRCPVGYLACPAGTHRLDYLPKPCPGCGRPDAPFDTDRDEVVCVDCHAASALGRA